MFNIFSLLGIACIIMLCLAACKKRETDSPPSIKKDYYQLKTGNYIIYQVDSTVYQVSDTIYAHYQIKEYIDSSYQDLEGRTVYKIIRYYRNGNPPLPSDSIPWQVKDVWSIFKNEERVEKTEENTVYVKLIYPAKSGLTWNGNIKNSLGEQVYKYENEGQTATVGNTTFINTVKVIEKNTINLISYHTEYEIYSEGIGLLNREIINVKSNTITTVPILDRITEGWTYSQRIISYHIEP